MNEWWRKAVVYQIYPKSFHDTTGNGVGDLRGIIAKLDYLQNLGVDVLWLTPIYSSPQRDHGYDIRDYYSIHEEYGTMDDFDELLQEAHARGLKVIMDIVVNHTSTEHSWFQQARSSRDNPYRDFYIWKDPVDGGEPNNWKSKFGGSAWAWDEEAGQYFLHLFDVTQADLNWENERVRHEVYKMMRWWLDKGVDGFRLDVINLISKDQRFPDDDGSVPPGDGRRFYTDGPRVHEFLREMNEEVFSRYPDVMTVGEMSSTTIPHCIRYTNPDSRELDMVFNFHHLKVDYPGGEKWALAEADYGALKKIFSSWQQGMREGGGWNALFWCNHDQPRVVSRFGEDGRYHRESAKMLATLLHMMQGTPYIYQGEEFGMTDPHFSSIQQYRDVETLNMYLILREKGLTEDEVMAIIGAKSRDNSRTPIQWDASDDAGFTTGTPWIDVAPNYREINAEKALADPDSILYHYKELIQLRKTYDIITVGDFSMEHPDDPDVFAYTRNTEGETLFVVNNMRGHETSFHSSYVSGLCQKRQVETLLSNYRSAPQPEGRFKLRPFESIVYRLFHP